jgi:Cro/C1-type HTH DNA-binding domain
MTPYPALMFRWTLKDTMDAHGITRYGLQKQSGLAMNTVRAMYEGSPTRVDFPAIGKVISALSALTGKRLGADSVFVWEEE